MRYYIILLVCFFTSNVNAQKFDDLYHPRGADYIYTVKNKKIGLIDTSGNILVENKYRDVYVSEFGIFVQKFIDSPADSFEFEWSETFEGKWMLIDTNNKPKSGYWFDDPTKVYPNSLGHYIYENDSTDYSGVFDRNGKEIIPPYFSTIYLSKTGIYYAGGDRINWLLVDTVGNIILEQKYDFVSEAFGNLIFFGNGGYSDFEIEGLIDLKGNIVLEQEKDAISKTNLDLLTLSGFDSILHLNNMNSISIRKSPNKPYQKNTYYLPNFIISNLDFIGYQTDSAAFKCLNNFMIKHYLKSLGIESITHIGNTYLCVPEERYHLQETYCEEGFYYAEIGKLDTENDRPNGRLDRPEISYIGPGIISITSRLIPHSPSHRNTYHYYYDGKKVLFFRLTDIINDLETLDKMISDQISKNPNLAFCWGDNEDLHKLFMVKNYFIRDEGLEFQFRSIYKRCAAGSIFLSFSDLKPIVKPNSPINELIK